MGKTLSRITSPRAWRRLFSLVRDSIGAPVCRDVHFELTALCNLKCIMCPVPIPGKVQREERLLSFDTFKEAIDNCKTLMSVGLNNWGEPLLHPRIVDMIAYSSSKGLSTILATNATLLTKNLSHEIIKAGLSSIEFSIDGAKETYDRIRKSNFDRVIQNIYDFIDINRKHRHHVNSCIVCTVGEFNEKEINQFAKLWNGIVDTVRFQPALTFQRSYRKNPCPELKKNHLVVLSDGRVAPCCADYSGSLTIGRVPEQPLNEIYNGVAMKALRRKHKDGDFEGACLYCSEYETPETKKRFN